MLVRSASRTTLTLLRPSAASLRHQPLSSPAAGAQAPPARVIRFLDASGEEHFGVFSNPQETRARIARRDDASGTMTMSAVDTAVDILLPPVDPLNVLCIGLNYRDHAREVGREAPRLPIVFSKTINAVTGSGSAIILPRVAPGEVDYEAELAVVIGRECKDVPEAEALEYVLGYTIANDVTARRWQGGKGGGQWTRSKSFDTFLPLGPYLVPRAAVPDPQSLTIRTWLNEVCVQDSNTSQMIFSVAQIIAFLSQDTTLLPGTVILTGTPAGVGYVKERYLRAGDLLRIEIQGLGTLRNVVADALPLA